jgi:hypothetical protein
MPKLSSESEPSDSEAGEQPNSPKFSGSEASQRSSFGSTDLNLTAASVVSNQLFGSSSRGEIITVLSRVDEEGGIEVLISDTRHTMSIEGAADSQGDHVTAYVNFLEMICIAVDDEEVEKIPDRIVEIAKCVLDVDHHGAFEASLQEFKMHQKKHLSREDRKKLTRLLRELMLLNKSNRLTGVMSPSGIETVANLGQPDAIEIIKKTMKDGDKLLLVSAINKLGEDFLKNIQKGSDIAFAKIPLSQQSEEEKKESKAEGTVVKMASYGLKSLSKLMKLKININAINEAKAAEDDSIEKSSVTAFVKDLTMKGSTLKSGLVVICEAFVKSEITDLTKRKGEAKKYIEKMIKTILDEDFDQQLPILLKLADGIIDNKSQENIAKLALKVGNLFEDMFDFRYARHNKQGEYAEYLLYKLVARHIVIMFTAFGGLKELSSDIQQKIINSFIEQGVLAKEGWNNCSVAISDGTAIKLNTEYMKHQLTKFSNLGNSDSRNFSMLKKEGNQDAIQQKNPKTNESALPGWSK